MGTFSETSTIQLFMDHFSKMEGISICNQGETEIPNPKTVQSYVYIYTSIYTIIYHRYIYIYIEYLHIPLDSSSNPDFLLRCHELTWPGKMNLSPMIQM